MLFAFSKTQESLLFSTRKNPNIVRYHAYLEVSPCCVAIASHVDVLRGSSSVPVPLTSVDSSSKKRRPITAHFQLWVVHFGPWKISRETQLQNRSERSRKINPAREVSVPMEPVVPNIIFSFNHWIVLLFNLWLIKIIYGLGLGSQISCKEQSSLNYLKCHS